MINYSEYHAINLIKFESLDTINMLFLIKVYLNSVLVMSTQKHLMDSYSLLCICIWSYICIKDYKCSSGVERDGLFVWVHFCYFIF